MQSLYLQPAPALRPFISTYIFLQSNQAEAARSIPPNLASGLAFLWGTGQVRHGGQVEALRAGRKPGNYIALDQLNAMQQGELRLAFEGVASFQSFIQQHFKLQLLRN